MSITKSEEAVATRIVRLQGGGLRFLDAHETAETDFQVVTRPHQDNDNQLWRIEDFGGGFVSIQQVSTGRFLEATLGGDFAVVTRPAICTEQTWRIGGPQRFVGASNYCSKHEFEG